MKLSFTGIKGIFRFSVIVMLLLTQCQTESVAPEPVKPNPFEAKIDDIKLVAQN